MNALTEYMLAHSSAMRPGVGEKAVLTFNIEKKRKETVTLVGEVLYSYSDIQNWSLVL